MVGLHMTSKGMGAIVVAIKWLVGDDDTRTAVGRDTTLRWENA